MSQSLIYPRKHISTALPAGPVIIIITSIHLGWEGQIWVKHLVPGCKHSERGSNQGLFYEHHEPSTRYHTAPTVFFSTKELEIPIFFCHFSWPLWLKLDFSGQTKACSLKTISNISAMFPTVSHRGRPVFGRSSEILEYITNSSLLSSTKHTSLVALHTSSYHLFRLVK